MKSGLQCDHLRAPNSYGYIDWGHSMISITDSSDIGMSSDAITLPSTGYILKLVFIFISCVIMNIYMFTCCLNTNICTWIVSLSVILKCLFNYGIKIYWNFTYHLTQATHVTAGLRLWQGRFPPPSSSMSSPCLHLSLSPPMQVGQL
jgi:hypothetical protein